MKYEKVYLNCDGGSRNNPGHAAIGIVLRNKKDRIFRTHGEYIDKTTNNIAEYKALIKGLELASQYTTNEVHVFMDSQLVVNQIQGIYKVKKLHFLPLIQRIKKLEKQFQKVNYTYVPRTNPYQVLADKEVNIAFNEFFTNNNL